MSNSNLPPGVTDSMVESAFGGPEDEGDDIASITGEAVVTIMLDGNNLLFLVSGPNGRGDMEFELRFSLGEARLLSEAINRRVM